MDITKMQQEAWQNSEDKGFHNGPEQLNIPTKLMLIACEVAEVMEEYRKPNWRSWYLNDNGKPEGVAAELADIIIRVGDLAGILRINLDLAVREKMAYNKTREHMHGKTI